MIKFEGVTKKFGGETVALKNINFNIQKGEFIFITGPSGAGKTTLLRLILRELMPDEGKIIFEEKDIASLPKNKLHHLRRKIGGVFQDFKLLSDRTIFENVALNLEIAGINHQETSQRVSQVLDLVGLEGKEKLFPRQLAGGELQRAALARSLVGNPKLIFADEPTGNLDPQTSWQIVDLLKKINKQGMTFVIATHNFEIVDSMNERVIHLEKGRLISDTKKGKYKK